jgi:type I restriction enzyme, S subunit
MSKNMKIIPELRFPEFKKEGEWQQNVVSQVADYENGKAHEQDIDEEGKYVVVNSKFISTDGEVRKFSNSANCIAKKNDVLMVLSDVPNGRAIAKCFYVDKDDSYTVNQRICKLTPTTADSRILYYLLNRNSYFLSFDDGVKQTNLRNEDVLNCPIVLPKNPQEQQKIASCLSSLDEVIAAHSQKLELLKDHKKGLMQNLFPTNSITNDQLRITNEKSITNYESSITSEDDQFVIRNSQIRNSKVPKYRFKEFEKDGEWVEKKLGDVADFINGKAYKQEELLTEGKYRVLRVGNFFTNNEWYYSDLELDEDKYCEKDDLLYAWSASFGPHIWKEEKVIYHYHIWKVKNKIGVDRQFLYNLLDYETFRMKAKSLNGFALMHITKGTIEAWESMIPKSEKEQQKIASCLSSLDTLITAQAEKIEQLQLHKKGLMQGLFPKSITNYESSITN